jgi:hypothetical protein
MMSNMLNATAEMGYYGNIWVRKNVLSEVGAVNEGHKHHFDHVTLLTTGTVKVHVEGYEPTVYVAPTFITIKKEHNHTFEALTDNCIWFCLFAMRDPYGEVVEDPDLYTPENTPYRFPKSAAGMTEQQWSDMRYKQNIINSLTIEEQNNNEQT